MMRIFIPLIHATAFCFLTLAVQAQQSHSIVFNDYAPQQLDYRLAHQPQTAYFSLPALGNASMSISNSMVHPAEWLSQTDMNPLSTLNLDEVFASWASPNLVGASVEVDWLQFGLFLNEKSSFVHGGIRESVQFSLSMPSDLMTLPWTGNANFELLGGGGLELSGLAFHAEHTRSFYAGWQQRWNDRFSSGLRLSYIQGIRHLQLSTEDLTWNTNSDTWDWELTGQGSLLSSGMWPLVQAIESGDLEEEDEQRLKDELKAGLGNGLGVDLGLEYKWSPKWTSFCQVNEVGSVRWKSDILNYTTQPAALSFSGLTWVESEDWLFANAADSLADWGQGIAEELEEQLSIQENNNGYRTKLGTRWSLGTEYSPWPESSWKPSLGIVLLKESSLPMSWRMSWNQQWGRIMETSLTWGGREGLGQSAGVGIAFNAGPIVLTLAADSHRMLQWSELAVDSTKGVSESYYVPSHAPLMQFQAGIVLRFGWWTKKNHAPSKTECETFDVPSSSSKPNF